VPGDGKVRAITGFLSRLGSPRPADDRAERIAASVSIDDSVYPTKAIGKFLGILRGRASPVLLDLGPVVGHNITFLGEELGCKIHVEDLYADLDRHVRAGTLDMCQVGVTGYDKFQMLYVPYLFGKDRMMAFTRSDIAESWRQSLLKDWNVQLLSYVYFGPRHITAKKAITRPDDLRGVKIRVPQLPTLVDAFKSWNANVVAMAIGELYIGLQTGNLDAQENPLNFIVSNSLFEVQTDLTLSAHAQAPRYFMINAGSLKRLSPEDQKSLQSAANDMASAVEKTLKGEDEQYLQTLKSKGMRVHEIDVTPFVAAVKSVGGEQAAKVWGPGVLDKIRSQFGPTR